MKPQSRFRRNGEKFGLFNTKNAKFWEKRHSCRFREAREVFRTTGYTENTEFLTGKEQKKNKVLFFVGNSRALVP